MTPQAYRQGQVDGGKRYAFYQLAGAGCLKPALAKKTADARRWTQIFNKSLNCSTGRGFTRKNTDYFYVIKT
jgi:hypothetical protein